MANHSDTKSKIPSASVLAVVPDRAGDFLRGVVLFPAARAALEAGGYSEDDHREGVRLLTAFFAYPRQPASSVLDDQRAVAADSEIRAWVRVNFSRLISGVRRIHGPTCSLFTGIDSPHEEEAVLALATLLERIEHASPEDRPGCATLEKRGLDTAERERLSRLLAVARAFTPVAVDAHAPDRRIEELVALYEWHADWAKTARAKIRDRNLLAALGIARKKWRTPPSSSESTDT